MSSKPCKTTVLVDALSTLCNHRISTCFAQRRATIQTGKTQAWRTLCDTRRNTLPLARPKIRRRPKRKFINSSKIAWRFCFWRNPSGNLVPECGPPNGVNWRLAELDAATRRADAQAGLDTQSLSSTPFFIPERQWIAQGENQENHLRGTEFRPTSRASPGHREACRVWRAQREGVRLTVVLQCQTNYGYGSDHNSYSGFSRKTTKETG